MFRQKLSEYNMIGSLGCMMIGMKYDQKQIKNGKKLWLYISILYNSIACMKCYVLL